MDRIDFISSSPAPIAVADKRPTADAAALARDPRPEMPLPIGQPSGTAPLSTAQSATVSRSLLMATGVEEADKTRAIAPAPETQRLLKPYGIRMLPEEDGKSGPPSTPPSSPPSTSTLPEQADPQPLAV